MQLRIGSLLCAAALAIAAPAPAQQPAPARPNLLFLFADDQRPDTIGALGNEHVKTPHLDRLVQEGYSFSRAYCMGSMGGAVCVPSRAMIHGGRSLFRTDNRLRGVTTLGEVLRGAGYQTFGTGKWHNGERSFVRGFERGRAVMFGGMSDHTRVPLRDLGADGELTAPRLGEGFSSTLFADAAIDFLERCDPARPFFAYVAFTAPHDPRQAPAEYLERFDPAKIPLPPSFLPQHPFDTGWMTGRDEALAAWPRTEEVIRQQTAEYYALLSHLDHEVGRILAALERSGRAGDTVVVYAADHGLSLGGHGLLGKQNLYETSTRVPLVFRGPGVPRGQVCDELTYLFDLFPTLCELAGAAAPEGVEGRSLAAVWRGQGAPPRASLFTAFGKVMRAVRDDRYKLIRYAHIHRTQLFDLHADPHEMRDLAAEPEHRDRVRRMTARLGRWQRRMDDPHPLSWDEPRPAEIDLTGHPRRPDRHQPEWIVRKYFDGGGR